MLSISEIKTTLSENSIQGVMGLFFKAFFNNTPSFRLGQNVVKTRSGENAEVTGIGPFFPIIFENDGLMCDVNVLGYPYLAPFSLSASHEGNVPKNNGEQCPKWSLISDFNTYGSNVLIT